MKKFTAIILAALMLFAFVACGNDKDTETTTSDAVSTTGEATTADTTEESTTAGTTEKLELSAIVEGIYAAEPVELMLGEPMPVDISDADTAKAFLGLDDVSNVKEAVFSEPMMGSQAYSLVLVRVNDASKLEETKKAMFDGIALDKWICVWADQARAASADDVIMFVMIDSVLATDLGNADLANGLVEAFKTVSGGTLTGEILSK